MMTDIPHLISNPKLLSSDTLVQLQRVVEEYPYYQSARLLYLHNLFVLRDERFGDELRKAALCVADRNLIFQFVEGANYKIEPKSVGGSVQPSMDRTMSLIDDFLSQLPHESQVAVEKPALQAPSAADAVDYTSYLLTLDDAEEVENNDAQEVPAMRGQDIIDKFISNRGGGRIELPVDAEVPIEAPVADYPLDSVDDDPKGGLETADPDGEDEGKEMDESCFTETLARIYIKQHRYEKALDIIQRLSLKNPKKNVYFADQIRFLKKLIINSKKQ